MFIFLYGSDIFRSSRKLKEIIKYYKETCKSGFNLKYFDLSSQISKKPGEINKNSVFQDFIDEIQQVSIFKEKKLIVLFNIFSITSELRKGFLVKEKEDKFLTKLAGSDNIILFYEEKEVSKKDLLFIFLKKHGKCQEFKLLNNQRLENWIKKEFFTYKVEISQRAVQALVNSVGNNLWQLSNEIKKLISYKKGKKIEIEDVNLLVRPKIETDIFKTIEAMAVKNKKQALSLLHKHLEKGDNPLYLLSMISFQFRNLLIIKDLIEKGRPFYALAKETHFHPYVIRKTYSQAQKFSIQELKKIYQKIFQIDLKIKTGQLDTRLALDMFIAEI